MRFCTARELSWARFYFHLCGNLCRALSLRINYNTSIKRFEIPTSIKKILEYVLLRVPLLLDLTRLFRVEIKVIRDYR